MGLREQEAAAAKEQDTNSKRRRTGDESSHRAKAVSGAARCALAVHATGAALWLQCDPKLRDARQQEGKQEVQEAEVRESKHRRSSSRNDEKRGAKESRASKTSEDQEKDQPRESKRTETKEERKLRKEREARKAAKKSDDKQERAREGSSKSREERKRKDEERKEARKDEKGDSQHEGGSSKSRAPEAAKAAAPSAAGASGSSKRAKEGVSRSVKEGKEPKESMRDDKGKGKGKAPMYEEEEEPVGSYEAASKARKLALHTEIAQDLPDAKRLQTLLELAVEAECGAVREHLAGRHAGIADMFEEACSQFIVESEGITISKLKRAASRPAAPVTLKPNPVNEAYAREEAQLKQTLERFIAEEQDWHRVLAAPVSATPQPTFAPLPPAGSMPASSHVLMNELSIAHRNMLSSSTGKDSELSELLAWAHGHVHCGLDKPRKALANVEERSERVQQLHTKLIQSTRSAVRAPFASAPSNPKQLLRALAAS